MHACGAAPQAGSCRRSHVPPAHAPDPADCTLLRQMYEEGYEVASHSLTHQKVGGHGGGLPQQPVARRACRPWGSWSSPRQGLPVACDA